MMVEKNPPVDVNGDITPIERNSIKHVKSADWMTCHLGQCYKELESLRNRLYIAQSMDKPEMSNQIQQGINTLEAIIKKRQNEKGNKHL